MRHRSARFQEADDVEWESFDHPRLPASGSEFLIQRDIFAYADLNMNRTTGCLQGISSTLGFVGRSVILEYPCLWPTEVYIKILCELTLTYNPSLQFHQQANNPRSTARASSRCSKEYWS